MVQEKNKPRLGAVRTVWERYPWIFLFLYSFAVMLFCTRSSPLYVFNGWPDANAYFTMGKGLISGMVPYRDLFDHKGPLTYLLFGLGALVQRDGFFGVYLVQSVMLGVTLCFACKTLLLFSGSKPVCVSLSLLLGMFLLQGSCYVDGGGSPDEFAVTFEMVSLYYFTRYFRSEEQIHRPWVMFLHGAMAGCVLLLKFNLVLFWVGFGAMVFLKLLVGKQYGSLLKNLLFLLLGVAAVCLPYLLYALATGSLDDFIEAYFGYNLLYSNVKLTVAQKILAMLKSILKYNILNISIFAMGAGGIVFFLFRKHCRGGWYWKTGAALSYLLSLVSIYFSEKTPPYVFLPHTVFSIFGLMAIAELLDGIAAKGTAAKKASVGEMLFVGLMVFAVTVSANGYIAESRLLAQGRGPVPQEQFAQIMHQRRENPTMLMYGSLDNGFYTAAGILPVNRFYFKPNGVPYEQYPDILDDQNSILRDRKVDFVVCRTDSPEETQVNNQLLNENYTLIAISEQDVQFPLYYLLFEAKR